MWGPCKQIGTRRLPMVQFAYNTAKHVSTGGTPFFLNYGRHPVVPAKSVMAVPAADSPVQHVPALKDFLQELRASMGSAISASGGV